MDTPPGITARHRVVAWNYRPMARTGCKSYAVTLTYVGIWTVEFSSSPYTNRAR